MTADPSLKAVVAETLAMHGAGHPVPLWPAPVVAGPAYTPGDQVAVRAAVARWPRQRWGLPIGDHPACGLVSDDWGAPVYLDGTRAWWDAVVCEARPTRVDRPAGATVHWRIDGADWVGRTCLPRQAAWIAHRAAADQAGGDVTACERDHPRPQRAAAVITANQYRTDGYISRSVAATLLDLSGLGMRMWSGELLGGGEDASWKLVVEDLEDAGLWEPCSGGWMIHDYDQYQPTKADLARKADAGQKGGWAGRKHTAEQAVEQTGKQEPEQGGKHAGRSSAQAPAQQNASTRLSKRSSNLQAKGQAVPVPVPDPLTLPGKVKGSSSSSSTRASPTARDDEEDRQGGKGTPKVHPTANAPPATGVTVAASKDGTATRDHALTDHPGGHWVTPADYTLAAIAARTALAGDRHAWAADVGVMLAEHVAEHSRSDVAGAKVAQLQALALRYPVGDVVGALEVALTDPAVKDPVAYARTCLADPKGGRR